MTSAPMSWLLCDQFYGDRSVSQTPPQSTSTRRKGGTTWFLVKSLSQGSGKKKKEKKTKIWDPSSGHPVGGLLSPSLTPTHQYCPSCPAGRTPLAGYSDRAAGQVAGRGNPLQDSCLENPMDKGAWWSVVHRVAKSWTWLSDLAAAEIR